MTLWAIRLQGTHTWIITQHLSETKIMSVLDLVLEFTEIEEFTLRVKDLKVLSWSFIRLLLQTNKNAIIWGHFVNGSSMLILTASEGMVHSWWNSLYAWNILVQPFKVIFISNLISPLCFEWGTTSSVTSLRSMSEIEQWNPMYRAGLFQQSFFQ